VPDDDLDLDLDFDTTPSRAAAPAPAAAPTAPAAAPAADAPAPGPAEKAAGPQPRKPAVVTVKPSLAERARAPFARAAGTAWPPAWRFRSFLLGLLILILALVVVENWPPMRLSLFGLHADIPKALVLLADFLAGFAVAWLLLRRGNGRGPEL
jgi:uncharacterized integral membrane protein